MFPLVYYLISGSLFVVLIGQCRPERMLKRALAPMQADAFFLGVALLFLTFMRLPSVFYNREFNADESQLITHAITLTKDPVYGRSVDGTTIGPINSYLLLIPHAFGLPFDYTSARLIGLLLIAFSLVFYYRSLLWLTSPLVSRLSVLPVLLFFSWSTHTDFLHYSSELSSLLLITACFFLTIRLLKSERTSLGSFAVLGIVAGLTPYAKLQTLPIVGMMLITLSLYLFSTNGIRSWSHFLTLSVGFLLPTVFVFSLAYQFGVEGYFIDYYFIANLTTYSQLYAYVPLVSQGLVSKLVRVPAFLGRYTDFLIFMVLPCVVTCAGALVMRFRQGLPGVVRWSTGLVLVTVAGAWWAVITPGTEFGHHLLLLVFPMGWVISLALQSILNSTSDRRVPARLVTMTAGLLIVSLVLTDNLVLPYSMRLVARLRRKAVDPVTPESTQTSQAWLLAKNPSLFSFPDKTKLALSPVSQVIERYSVPSDQLAVWGWNCRYYVETGLAQGVSESHTQRSITPNYMRDQYLSRYARELRDNRPTFFLDAVGNESLLLQNENQKHEHFAIIDQVIHQNYTYKETVDDVRIYVYRDRLLR